MVQSDQRGELEQLKLQVIRAERKAVEYKEAIEEKTQGRPAAFVCSSLLYCLHNGLLGLHSIQALFVARAQWPSSAFSKSRLMLWSTVLE